MSDSAAGPEQYLELAREIHAEVSRIAADPFAGGDALAEVFERVPVVERVRLATRVFESLDPDAQWRVLERAFGDDAIGGYLRDAMSSRRDELTTAARHRAVVARARAAGVLDVRATEEGDMLVLGLFAARDVREAVDRGSRSTSAARRLVLRSLGDGAMQVLHDVFNPEGGHFVTGAYTEEQWRANDRLESHTIVRVGAIVGERFDPLLYPGGRVDVLVDGRRIPGRLHLGFAMVGREDVFVPERSTA